MKCLHTQLKNCMNIAALYVYNWNTLEHCLLERKVPNCHKLIYLLLKVWEFRRPKKYLYINIIIKVWVYEACVKKTQMKKKY